MWINSSVGTNVIHKHIVINIGTTKTNTNFKRPAIESDLKFSELLRNHNIQVMISYTILKKTYDTLVDLLGLWSACRNRSHQQQLCRPNRRNSESSSYKYAWSLCLDLWNWRRQRTWHCPPFGSPAPLYYRSYLVYYNIIL